MLFLILAVISVIVAVVQVRRRGLTGQGPARPALLLGGISLLAGWVIQALVLRLASTSFGMGLPVDLILGVQRILLTLVAMALWSALVQLAFNRFRRRDLLLIVPFGALSIIAGVFYPGAAPMTVELLAWPALLRLRWKRELSTGTQAIVSLFALLLLLLQMLPVRIHAPDAGPLSLPGLERYFDWVRGLTSLYLITALPRLLWGLNLPIRSVKLRLLVSHLLAGLVPMALILVFISLNTYLSVSGERVRIAAGQLRESAEALGPPLEAAMSYPQEAEHRLLEWARLESSLRPGIRVWVMDPPSATKVAEPGTPAGALRRIYGDPIFGEEAVISWDRIMPDHGVLLVAGSAYLGAARVLPGDHAGGIAAVALVPVSSVLSSRYQQMLDAQIYLETGFAVRPTGGRMDFDRAGSDSPGTAERTFAPALEASAVAELVPAMLWTGTEWKECHLLLRVRVNFLSALRGLTRDLSADSYNLLPLMYLAGVGILFLLLVLLTSGIVLNMGRSILRALNALRQGTARLRSGNLLYRIPIEGNDDLWDVAGSFNDMAADLDKARDLEIEKERLESELDLAREIQTRLLPREAPVVPRTELAGLSVPARQVGGDYFDFLPLSGNRIGLMVADVSGKGVPAALLMSSFRASLLSLDLDRDGPAATLARLNAFLYHSVEPGRFVTAFLAVLDPATGRLLYSNAGHNPPLLIKTDLDTHFLREGGLVLGLFGNSRYRQAEVRLDPADLLVLYTDGVTEAADEDDDMWGEERFYSLLCRHREHSCRDIVGMVLDEVSSFSGRQGQTDDITLVIVRWRGPAVEERPLEEALPVPEAIAAKAIDAWRTDPVRE